MGCAASAAAKVDKGVGDGLNAINSFGNKGPRASTDPPAWTRSLYIDQEMLGGFNACSEGLTLMTNNHFVRERKGTSVTDAARWCKPMTSGKHVFEVKWPANTKGSHSCIGVGSKSVPLSKQGKLSLVGHLSHGWCLDISRRRVIHKDQMLKNVPHGIPDVFYMYCDMDSGKISFGESLELRGMGAIFFGNIITNITLADDNPLYLMVSCLAFKEQVMVYYKGTACPGGGFDLLQSVLPQQQVVAPAQAAAAPVEEKAPPPYEKVALPEEKAPLPEEKESA